LYPKFIWNIRVNKPVIYLTFDDGPIPKVTEFVLDELNKYEAKATFFCIGENIQKHKKVFEKIMANGHSIGNHTMNHLNGWDTDNQAYINNFNECQLLITESNLFRPPYGKIKRNQAKVIQKTHKVIMWDIISGDFLQDLDPEICLQKCIKYTEPGTIIVFHDSLKASRIMQFVLPKYLAYFHERGYAFEPIIL
jgi:peptidoglycan-N-acetylglucosamine deacetylase